MGRICAILVFFEAVAHWIFQTGLSLGKNRSFGAFSLEEGSFDAFSTIRRRNLDQATGNTVLESLSSVLMALQH